MQSRVKLRVKNPVSVKILVSFALENKCRTKLPVVMYIASTRPSYETHWRKGLWSAAQSPAGGGLVTSRIPQELILGLILFNVFISDLDDGAECTFCKFASGRKLGGVADTADGCAAIQRDLNRLEKWMEKTLTKGTVKSCTWGGALHQYMLRIKQLKRSLSERDLGALIDKKLNTSHQFALAAKTVNSIRGCIRKHTASRLWEVILHLYSAQVRHLWSAVSRSGAFGMRETCNILEQVQWRAMEMI